MKRLGSRAAVALAVGAALVAGTLSRAEANDTVGDDSEHHSVLTDDDRANDPDDTRNAVSIDAASTDDGYAGPPPSDEHLYAGDGLFRPPIEWSTWLRAGYGVAQAPTGIAARRVDPVGPVGAERHGSWDLGAGIEASLALSRRGNVRLGGWFEMRGLSSSDTFGGAELVITRVPSRMDMFLYEGHGILAVRAGRSSDQMTASVAYGYVAPYWLEGPCRMRFYGINTGVCSPRPERTARYMAGVRLVATATRAIDDPRTWTATLGLELDPVGALRMMTVARSWY